MWPRDRGFPRSRRPHPCPCRGGGATPGAWRRSCRRPELLRVGRAVGLVPYLLAPFCQGDVQLKNVDGRLAQIAEVPSLNLRLDERLDLGFVEAAGQRNCMNLE